MYSAGAEGVIFYTERIDFMPLAVAAVPEALVYMIRAYNRLGVEDLAGDGVRVLELNYPDHPALPALREGRDPVRARTGIMSWFLGSPR